MLKSVGILSTKKIFFNSERVFHLNEIKSILINEPVEITESFLIDDNYIIIKDYFDKTFVEVNYGCGVYILKKKSASP